MCSGGAQPDPSGQEYAFKLLGPTSNARARERFRQELNAITRVSHPGISKVIEHADQDGGVQYYAMEYVPGLESLRKRMERNTNPFFFRDPLKAVGGRLQIMRALSAVREAAVHRAPRSKPGQSANW